MQLPGGVLPSDIVPNAKAWTRTLRSASGMHTHVAHAHVAHLVALRASASAVPPCQRWRATAAYRWHRDYGRGYETQSSSTLRSATRGSNTVQS